MNLVLDRNEKFQRNHLSFKILLKVAWPKKKGHKKKKKKGRIRKNYTKQNNDRKLKTGVEYE